jgi:hypothetical protein
MKYLKTFEEIVISGITFKYNVGDYVLLNEEEMDKNTIQDNVKPHELTYFKVKIIEILNPYPYPYITETYDNNKCAVKETEIIRKLTYAEIKEYKLKKQTTKYNI